jgi:hypothetical protein
MSDLLTRLRRLIGDQAVTPVWDDQSLQDAFDVYQVIHSFERTQPQATILPGGKRKYFDYYSDGSVGNWENDESLTDATFNPLTPLAADRINGHWSFDKTGNSIGLVVWLSGKTYDIYGAAADVCRQWAAQVKLEFDFRTKERQYSRAQQYKMLIDLAETYDEKRLPGIAQMIRMDVPMDQPLLGPYMIDPGNDLGRGRVR